MATPTRLPETPPVGRACARPLMGLPVHARSDRALVLAAGEARAAVVIEGVLGLAALDDRQPAPPRLDARAILAAIRRARIPLQKAEAR